MFQEVAEEVADKLSAGGTDAKGGVARRLGHGHELAFPADPSQPINLSFFGIRVTEK